MNATKPKFADRILRSSYKIELLSRVIADLETVPFNKPKEREWRLRYIEEIGEQLIKELSE